MSTAFNLVDFDDGPTLVMHRGATEVMDRRQFPPSSGIMPVARPVASHAVAPPHVAPAASAADQTQPALRIRKEAAGMRRLAIGLAIGFAFAIGLVASYAAQMATSAPPVVATTASREPRTVTDRSSSLDTRSAPLLRDAPPAATVIVRAAPSAAPSTPSTMPEEPHEDLEGHDLLKEGL